MWSEEGGQDYYWIVLCKNHHYHHKQSRAADYQILLGETDAVSPPPALERKFTVTCDDCGKEYTYKPSELLRYETEAPESFLAHPLFRNLDSVPIPPRETADPTPSFITTAQTRPSFSQFVRGLLQRSDR